jgi:hypothetical protein
VRPSTARISPRGKSKVPQVALPGCSRPAQGSNVQGRQLTRNDNATSGPVPTRTRTAASSLSTGFQSIGLPPV